MSPSVDMLVDNLATWTETRDKDQASGDALRRIAFQSSAPGRGHAVTLRAGDERNDENRMTNDERMTKHE
jgi:hypothetical protein